MRVSLTVHELDACSAGWWSQTCKDGAGWKVSGFSMHHSWKGLTLVGRSVPGRQATHRLHPSDTEASVSTVMLYCECQGAGKARSSGLPMERAAYPKGPQACGEGLLLLFPVFPSLEHRLSYELKFYWIHWGNENRQPGFHPCIQMQHEWALLCLCGTRDHPTHLCTILLCLNLGNEGVIVLSLGLSHGPGHQQWNSCTPRADVEEARRSGWDLGFAGLPGVLEP